MNFWQMLAMAIEKGDEALISELMKSDELRKSAVTAAGIGIGGALTPAASRQYFTTITDQSGFLGRVSSDQVDAIEQDVDLFHVQSRQLQRVAEGTEPTTLTGASNLGKRWSLKDVQMFPTVNFSTIVQRQRQGDIESYLAGLFATVFRNDLLLLGLEGDETGSGFAALNNGWPKLAKVALAASYAAQLLNVTMDGTVPDYMATMLAMLQAMPDEYLIEGRTAFVMSRKAAIGWGDQMAANVGLNPYLVTGEVPSYQGYEVIGVPNFPANEIMLTDPANLGFGMGTTIQRWREIKARKRCIEYTWNLYADYLIINDGAVVYAKPA